MHTHIKRYLSTLHQKPAHHQKRFSLLVSGCFTLLIFAIWIEVHFGVTSTTVAEIPETPVTDAVSPVGSLKANASDAWSLLTGEINKAKDGLQSVNLQDSYTQVRDDALQQQPIDNLTNPTNQYGQ